TPVTIPAMVRKTVMAATVRAVRKPIEAATARRAAVICQVLVQLLMARLIMARQVRVRRAMVLRAATAVTVRRAATTLNTTRNVPAIMSRAAAVTAPKTAGEVLRVRRKILGKMKTTSSAAAAVNHTAISIPARTTVPCAKAATGVTILRAILIDPEVMVIPAEVRNPATPVTEAVI